MSGKIQLSRRRFGLLATAGVATLAAPAIVPFRRDALAQAAGAGGAPRNVILMISDGAGFHTWNAASYFEFGELGRQVYDSFPVKTLMSTFPLNTSTTPTNDTTRRVGYDPARAWSMRPMPGEFTGAVRNQPYRNLFEGYHFVRQDYVDSAAAGTALAAGIKTYNNAINFDNMGRPVRMVGDVAKSAGKALGVVTSVQVSHATPASFSAHNISRNNYAEIGREIVEAGLCDVMMGAGHPFFDNNGRYRAPTNDRAFQYVGGPETYLRLATDRTAYQWIETKADFEALARGQLALRKEKVLGVAQAATTLQYQRTGQDMGSLNQNVPDLTTMTNGALHVLARNPNGFFLMVEGGAVDWAAHGNNTGRIIEEQIDFNRAVRAVVSWIERNGGFDETLLIVTTDHGNGMAYGPDSDRFAFQPVQNRGRGLLPDVKWHFDTHTNELVPVWAAGPGSERLRALATNTDPHVALVGWSDAPRYHDNTDIGQLLLELVGATRRRAAN